MQGDGTVRMESDGKLIKMESTKSSPLTDSGWRLWQCIIHRQNDGTVRMESDGKLIKMESTKSSPLTDSGWRLWQCIIHRQNEQNSTSILTAINTLIRNIKVGEQIIGKLM